MRLVFMRSKPVGELGQPAKLSEVYALEVGTPAPRQEKRLVWMNISVFTADGRTYEEAAEKAQDQFIDYCVANRIADRDIVSFTPISMDNSPFGYKVSLWLLRR